MLWLLLAFISGLGAALLAIVIKLHLKHIHPMLITFLLSIIAIIILLIVGFSTKKANYSFISELTKKDWMYLVIAGLLNMFSFTCYVLALKLGKTSGVVAIDRLGILYVVILSVIFLQETLSIKSIIGAIIMILGVILINL